MSDKPIIFSAPMVRALLDGRKTQTRRLAWGTSIGTRRLSIGGSASEGCEYVERRKPSSWQKVQPGDRLWVRENWAPIANVDDYRYRARLRDEGERVVYASEFNAVRVRWKPSIHMPRWASRLTLTVTAVRRQRLQEISDADARAEGCPGRLGPNPDFPDERDPSPTEEFAELWRTLHGADAWDSNPDVVALTFTVERRNIDAR